MTLNLLNRTFGRLTVLRVGGRIAKSGHRYWEVRCACGREALALGSDLKRGRSESCGCLRREDAIARRADGGRFAAVAVAP